MRVDRLDHLVLTVADVEASVALYTTVLGMTETTFGDGRTALRFGTAKINLHAAGREFEPNAAHRARELHLRTPGPAVGGGGGTGAGVGL